MRHETHPEPLEQRLVAINLRVRRRQQLLSHKDRVGSGDKTERLSFIGERESPGTEPHPRSRHEYPGRRDHSHQLQWILVGLTRKRRSFDPHQQINRHALWVWLL